MFIDMYNSLLDKVYALVATSKQVPVAFIAQEINKLRDNVSDDSIAHKIFSQNNLWDLSVYLSQEAEFYGVPFDEVHELHRYEQEQKEMLDFFVLALRVANYKLFKNALNTVRNIVIEQNPSSLNLEEIGLHSWPQIFSKAARDGNPMDAYRAYLDKVPTIKAQFEHIRNNYTITTDIGIVLSHLSLSNSFDQWQDPIECFCMAVADSDMAGPFMSFLKKMEDYSYMNGYFETSIIKAHHRRAAMLDQQIYDRPPQITGESPKPRGP